MLIIYLANIKKIISYLYTKKNFDGEEIITSTLKNCFLQAPHSKIKIINNLNNNKNLFSKILNFDEL